MVDGTLKFDTRIDTVNFVAGIKNIKTQAATLKQSLSNLKNALRGGINTKSATKSINDLKNVSESAKKSIESILSDVETSSKAKAGKIAGVLKKEGYSTSDSMKSAWSLIERQVKSTNDKNVKDTKKSNRLMRNDFESTATGIGLSFKKLAGTLASLVGIWQVINFAKSSIELGSAVTEVQNVVDTAFGAMSYKIEDFSKTCIENFGMSKLTAKQMASTYMAMATGMGQGMDFASDRAVELTGRLGDVASFYNKTMSEVDTIGRAIYSGETEPLKAIGVVMTEANLDAWTLANGYSQVYSKMDQVNKLAVRQDYFLDATKMAAGDFVKTQDSWANQTRILSERLKELKSIIGSGLIVVLKPLIKDLNNILSILIDTASTLGEILTDVFGIQIDSGSAGSSQMADDYSSAADSANDTLKATKELNKQLSGIDKLDNISSSKTDSSTDSQAIGGSIVPDTTLIEGEDKVGTKLEKWNSLLGPLKTSIDNFKKSLSSIEDFNSQAFDDFNTNFIEPFGKFTLSEDGIPRLIDITTRFNNDTDWKSLNKSLASFFSSIEPIAEITFDGVADFYDYFLEPLASWTVGEGLPQVLDILTEFNTTVKWDAINKAFEKLEKAAEPLAEAFGQGLIDFYKDAMAIGADVINVIVPGGINALADALEKIDPDVVQSIAYALAAVGTSIALITISKTLLTNLGALYTTLSGLSTFSQIAIAVTLSVAAIKFAHQKWKELVSKEDFDDIQEGMHDMWVDILGDNFLAKVMSDTCVGLGYIFSGYATPKEWLKGFKEFGKDCWEAFKYRISEGAKNNKWVKKLNKITIPALLVAKYSYSNLKDIAGKIKSTIKRKGLLGAGVELLCHIKEKFSPSAAWKNVKNLWGKSKKTLQLGLALLNKNNIIKSILSTLVSPLNALIRQLNKKLSFKIPKWIPGFGGKTWGVHMKEIKIPKLATGAVIPPNREFLAVLGDQRNGTNVEAPLSTIQKALANELDRRGNNGSDGNITIVIELDGEVVYKKVVSKDKEKATAKGMRSALAGG